jgi:hypothetical protein
MGIYKGIEKYMLKTLVQSQQARAHLLSAWIWMLDVLVRMHLSIFICHMLTIRGDYAIVKVINWLMPIVISMGLRTMSCIILAIIASHITLHKRIISYFVNNATPANLAKWKRILVAGICTYVIAACCLVSVTSEVIIEATIQTWIEFALMDALEHGLHMRAARYLGRVAGNISFDRQVDDDSYVMIEVDEVLKIE